MRTSKVFLNLGGFSGLWIIGEIDKYAFKAKPSGLRKTSKVYHGNLSNSVSGFHNHKFKY